MNLIFLLKMKLIKNKFKDNRGLHLKQKLITCHGTNLFNQDVVLKEEIFTTPDDFGKVLYPRYDVSQLTDSAIHHQGPLQDKNWRIKKGIKWESVTDNTIALIEHTFPQWH